MGEPNPPPTDYVPHGYDEPSANLWSTYLAKSEKYDSTMAQNWKSDMDAILIFAGLFSASLTAFIVESYKTLNPDPASASAFVLGQILHQLASAPACANANANANATASLADAAPALAALAQFDQRDFAPAPSAVLCNVLWFLSLGFSLVCALSATLVEQWTRQYLQAAAARPRPQDRARMSAFLNEGLRTYRLAAIVDAIPLLLHISLFLFFAGLVAFLRPVSPALQYTMLALLLPCAALYLAITVLPTSDLACPYWTPLSPRCWALRRRLRLRLFAAPSDGDADPADPAAHPPRMHDMAAAREAAATAITPARDARDLRAMCWTLAGLRTDSDLEPLVAAVPRVVAGFDYSAKALVDALTRHPDVGVRLGHRIPGLLATCVGARPLDPAAAARRAAVCARAMWSLAMLAMPKPPAPQRPEGGTPRERLVFREDTLDLLERVQAAVPAAAPYVVSTATVIGRSLLDMYVERAAVLACDLGIIKETGRVPDLWTDEEICKVMEIVKTPDLGRLFEETRARVQSITANEFAALKQLTRPVSYAILEGLIFRLTRIVAIAAVPHMIFGPDRKLVLEVADCCVRTFQALINQAGLDIALLYLEAILQAEVLPHEAFNTLRRCFFRIDFGDAHHIRHRTKANFNKDSQERLLTCLEEVLEPGRLPHTLVGIVLNLAGRALTEPTLILRAISIIEDYTKSYTNESAPSALRDLTLALPADARASKPLDLFSSHVSADARPKRLRNVNVTK